MANQYAQHGRKRVQQGNAENEMQMRVRLAEGQVPSCVWSCPAQARVFGDLNDPNSDVSVLLRTRRAFRLKEDLGSGPMIWYVG